MEIFEKRVLMRLVVAQSQDHWRQARQFVEEYAASLDVDLSFQNFEHEVEHLATEYAAPAGAFFLAEENGVYVGCIGLRQFADGVGEIKRLYVGPAGRGRGAGRLLVEGVVAAAREMGYTRLVLDTLPSMKDAQRLYASLGFTPTAPYRFNPVPGTAYLEMVLRQPGNETSASREPSMTAVVVEFPLRGEWVAPNTPGHVVPSHGTHVLGQTYAYDLIQVDEQFPRKIRVAKKPFLSSLLFGVPLKECMAWSQPIYAPFPGEVVEAVDGVSERDPTHLARDLFVVLKNGYFDASLRNARSNQDLRHLLGNYVILKGERAYAMFAHGRNGSVCVRPGDKVTTGQKLAEVGHSGNSTTAHLHFQLMDNPDLLKAKGVPCCFREYELFENGAWRKVTNGIPGRRDRIRVT